MKRLLVLALGVMLLAGFVAPGPASAKPPPTTLGGATVPISYSDPTGSFTGTFTVNRFTSSGGELAAVGTVTGTVTNAATGVTQTVTQNATVGVLQASGSCTILHLELGPLDLNLLGLMVHLDRVVLDITAQQGPGNLLGNLLCAIAGLLDSNAPLNQLVSLLNQLLGLLG